MAKYTLDRKKEPLANRTSRVSVCLLPLRLLLVLRIRNRRRSGCLLHRLTDRVLARGQRARALEPVEQYKQLLHLALLLLRRHLRIRRARLLRRARNRVDVIRSGRGERSGRRARRGGRRGRIHDALVEEEARDVPVPKQRRQRRRVRIAHRKQHLAHRVLQPRVVYTAEEAEAAAEHVSAALEAAGGGAAVEVRGAQPVARPRAGRLVRNAQPRDEDDERGQLVVERVGRCVRARLGLDELAHTGVVRLGSVREVMREGDLKEGVCAQESVGGELVGRVGRP